jgi:hypothetical protein
MAPQTDKKYSEVFDAAQRANQFLQNNRNNILNVALSGSTAGLPVNQIKGGVESALGSIKSASNFANNNPQIQKALNNEYLGLAAGLNPVTGAASILGNISKIAGNFGENNTSQKPPRKTPSGNVTRVGGKTYRMDNAEEVKSLEAVLAADKSSRPDQKFADLRGGGGMTTSTPVGTPTPSADPRNADYLTARGKLTEDSTAEDIKKVEDIGMTAWAKANPKLAAKVKPGQAGYDQSQNVLGTSTQDQRDLASDMGVMGVNPEERMARAKGGIVEVDIDESGVGPARISPQRFKDDAMTALLTNFSNPNVTPIVEGLTIPTTTNYAGAFNQADMPDLQSMMNMEEQLGSLGIEGPKFAPSQKFKDLFQNTMLSK